MHTCPINAALVSLMLPSQHHASFSTTLKGFMVSLYARLKPFQHKNQPTRLRDEPYFYVRCKLGKACALFVSCISSTADTKLSFPYIEPSKFLKAPRANS